MLKYVGAVEMVAQILYKSILTSLEFNGELFSNFAPKIPRVIMGINYYPTCPDPSLTLGLSGHSDVSCLTILHPSEVPGLQIKHKGGWLSVLPIHETAFVVNLADQVEVCICKIHLHYISSCYCLVNQYIMYTIYLMYVTNT